ncbi:uncharacterized protein HaLaN_19115 [Haematococcus lacustris]|uniref:AAA+ ATPase domain-containing protein n=1 Tax=Haematococcus lacustris TaxID=44745 RepID=A0A699ZZS1_HAELA|nr:uncharacterized protein HaLaN_19115 [Haematococcus lacustris]
MWHYDLTPGESEAKLRSLFQEAADLAPCIVFIDEIDAIAPKRETAQREMERRIVAQMLTCMDDLSAPSSTATDASQQQQEATEGETGRNAALAARSHVVVIGATNRPDSLDPALRRAGRFDREITLGIPSESARAKILSVITRRLRLEGNFDFARIAKRTPGPNKAACTTAAVALLNRRSKLSRRLLLHSVRAGCAAVRPAWLRQDGPELLNKYVGESERAVRQLFARARAAHPCVLFFDEMDALAPRRGNDTNTAAERVVNQLLTEMDGIDGRQGVFLVAATNRPDMIDPALLRPGRLDKVLYVPLPPPDGRASILVALTRRTPLAPDVDVRKVGLSKQCDGFSGADLAALVREASVLALKQAMQQEASGSGHVSAQAAQVPCSPSPVPVVLVHAAHFEAALQRVQPSVSRKDTRVYEALRRSLRGNLRSRMHDVGPLTEAVSCDAPAVDPGAEACADASMHPGSSKRAGVFLASTPGGSEGAPEPMLI